MLVSCTCASHGYTSLLVRQHRGCKRTHRSGHLPRRSGHLPLRSRHLPLRSDIYLLGQDNFLLGQDNIGKGFTLSLTLCLSRFAWCPTGHATSHLCVPTTLGGSIQYKLPVLDCLAWLYAATILCSTQGLEHIMTNPSSDNCQETKSQKVK